MKRPIFAPLWAALCIVLMSAACTLSDVRPPTPPESQPTAPIQATATPAAGWRLLRDGLEIRTLGLPNDLLGQFIILRIDPTRYHFRAHYQPGAPLTLNQWLSTLDSPMAFINANFFDPQFNALGLIVSDGQAYGQSFVQRGGMFSVQGDSLRVRSLIQEPYSGEVFDQAVQGFPMLLLNGESSFRASGADALSRRTIIAQDTQGRIVILVTPLLGLSLTDASTFLAHPELDLVNALNLDGGGSSMLYVADGEQITSVDAVPAVLAIYPRD